MDMTFKTPEGRFNYRVCAVIIHEGKLLAMRDRPTSHYYLPGGRVHLHESANDAILREIHEELGIEAKFVRPLWFCENFFALDDSGERYHELSLYYLIDASEAKFLFENETFTLMEENEIHLFEWLPFEKLRDTYFYPLFLKKEIFHLPEHLTMITERKIESLPQQGKGDHFAFQNGG